MTDCVKAKAAKKPVAPPVEDALTAGVLAADAVDHLHSILLGYVPSYLTRFSQATVLLRPSEHKGLVEMQLTNRANAADGNPSEDSELIHVTNLPPDSPVFAPIP